jgi:hypothetical protein
LIEEKMASASIPIFKEQAIYHIINCRVDYIVRKTGEVHLVLKGEHPLRKTSEANFDTLSETAYSVYEKCGKIPVFDRTPEASKKLRVGYEIKNNRVFYNGEFIAEADSKTFEIINKEYAKDQTHVFYKGLINIQADPANCTIDNISGCKE